MRARMEARWPAGPSRMRWMTFSIGTSGRRGPSTTSDASSWAIASKSSRAELTSVTSSGSRCRKRTSSRSSRPSRPAARMGPGMGVS